MKPSARNPKTNDKPTSTAYVPYTQKTFGRLSRMLAKHNIKSVALPPRKISTYFPPVDRKTNWPQNIDYDVQPKDWLHPADTVRITEHQEESAIQIFTDGSKSEHGVGAGIALFIQSKLVHQMRFTLHNNCSNNQAEQLAIVKALETIKELQIAENIPRK